MDAATRKAYPSDLTDPQRDLIEIVIPAAKSGGRPRATDMREVINAMLYLERSGCQWDMLPHDLPPKSTVYEYFAAWRKNGTWQRMAGLPGAGKDTWLRTNCPNLPVVSLDDLREELDVAPIDVQGTVIQTARERCREHLRAKRDFAFNATNTVVLTRKRWIDLFADDQARVEIVYLEPPSERLRQQNRERAVAVPQRIMDKLLANLEPPTWSEAHTLCWESTT
jgi:predicted kinase